MKVRVLPREEWGLMAGVPMPMIAEYVSPDDADVVVVEDGKEIVACWTVVRTVHLEGVWIDPKHRNGGVIRGLIRKAMELAATGGRKWAFTGAADDGTREIISRLGGQQIPMDTWVLPLRRIRCQQQ